MSETEDPSAPYSEDARGFVYVLSNPAIPGYLKIGHTKANPFERAQQLYTTGVPEPFRVECAWYVVDSRATERAIHGLLSSHRDPGRAREFFRIPLDQAAPLIEREIAKALVPEVYSRSDSAVALLNQSLLRAKELEQEVQSLRDELASAKAAESNAKRQLTSTQKTLERYEEANEKIKLVDKIIEERNLYRDRYKADVQQLLWFALEYERFLIGLGGRFATWAEEQAKRRPNVRL